MRISTDLLFSLKAKFRRLSKEMDQSLSYIDRKGIPLCDFQINNESIKLYKKRIKEQKKFQRAQSETKQRNSWAK